ncbi:hypothetical protein FPV67DRAFT_1675342 [Lyophyllum atratum]|nr:hypothetical protein FPV67DRAFT_1675342 [Lyophyllum atratum]
MSNNRMSPPKCSHILMHNYAPLVGDAAIVVRAGLTTVKIKQRVLARNSEVFTRICKHAGSKTVVVLDDDPTDLVCYIDKMRASQGRKKAPITVGAVASLFRMGRKYEHQIMFREMATRVAKEFPFTLKKFDAATVAPFTVIMWTPGIEFDLIALAEKYGLATALPTLMYRVCRQYDPEERHAGIRRPDGTIAKLSTDHQLMCAIGEYRLQVAQGMYTLCWLYNDLIPMPGCISDEVCKAFILQTQLEVYCRGVRALERWEAKWIGGMCPACEHQAQVLVESGRKEVWMRLPDYFNLRTWRDAIRWQRQCSKASGPEVVVEYE